MKKIIKLRKVDGGSVLNVTQEDKTKTFVQVYGHYSEDKAEKFYRPAGKEIFDKVGDNFELLRYDSYDALYVFEILNVEGGYYVNIKQRTKQKDRVVGEFVCEEGWLPAMHREILYVELLSRFLKVIEKNFTEALNGTELNFEIRTK